MLEIKELVTPEEAFRPRTITDLIMEDIARNLNRGLWGPEPIETTCVDVTDRMLNARAPS